MIPRLYVWLAVAFIALAGFGAVYTKGRIDAAHRAEISRLELDLSTAKRVIAVEQKARQSDAILAAENARRAAALNSKIDELDAYVDTLEDRNRECLSGADVERLRDLWR